MPESIDKRARKLGLLAVRGVIYAEKVKGQTFAGALKMIRRQARGAASLAAEYLKHGGAPPERLSPEQARRFVELQRAHIEGALSKLALEPTQSRKKGPRVISDKRTETSPRRPDAPFSPLVDGEEPALPKGGYPEPEDAPAVPLPADAPDTFSLSTPPPGFPEELGDALGKIVRGVQALRALRRQRRT